MADYLATLTAKIAQSFHMDFLRSSIKHSDIIYTKSAVRADVDLMLKGEFRQSTRLNRSHKSEDSSDTLAGRRTVDTDF